MLTESKISFDSGWKVLSSGNCYVKRERTVVLQDATESEIQIFGASFKTRMMYGQSKSAFINGNVIKFVEECDSGG